MQPSEPVTATTPEPALAPLCAAEVQDDLLVTQLDMERLQRLLADAGDSLLGHFHAAAGLVKQALHDAAGHPELDIGGLHAAMEHLAGAITAMQFQDMANQLVDHTSRRLRRCADRLAADALGDEDGPAVIADAPLRPNPVTQDEMDAGSIELF